MATVKIYDDKYSSLNNIDWDFIGDKQDEISRLHPYPARFIESIPRALIEVLGIQPDCSVLDPFCGSGTTLLEAQKMGINSVGVDLNPIACLISTVKTQEYRSDLLATGLEIKKKAEANYHNQKLEIPNIPNLDHWFKEDIQKAIFTLTFEINKVNNLSLQNALRFCLSSIIVRVSNQESDTRYAAVENNSNAEDGSSPFLCVNSFGFFNAERIKHYIKHSFMALLYSIRELFCTSCMAIKLLARV